MEHIPALLKRCAVRSFVLALLFALASCAGSTPHAKQALIRLATYEWPGSFWIDVAWQKGWFQAEGLSVERIDTGTKYFESLDEMAAGKLDAMGFSQFDLVRYVAMGHDLVGVAAVDYSEGAEALVARPGIERLQELKGKRIALGRGTYLEYLLTVLAEREGLDLSHVTLVDGSGAEAVEALRTGQVDAVFVWEPYANRAVEASGGERLFSTAEFPGLTYNVLTFRRDFIEARPAQVQALLRVWQRSLQFIREHPDETCEIVAQLYGEPLPSIRDLMRKDRILDLADNGRAFSYAAGFESLHGSWRQMNDFMLERALVAQRVDSPDHLDSRFIRALE